jgi:hypothetical protein
LFCGWDRDREFLHALFVFSHTGYMPWCQHLDATTQLTVLLQTLPSKLLSLGKGLLGKRFTSNLLVHMGLKD